MNDYKHSTPAHLIESWVRLAREGNEQGFDNLYNEFTPRLWRYIAFRVPTEEAEDLVSQIWVKIIQQLPKYTSRPEASFAAWIFRITRNQIIDFYRSQKDVILASNDDEFSDWCDNLIDENRLPPDQNTAQNMDIDIMTELMKSLSTSQREILELKFLEGFTNREIAKLTGIKEGNIRIIQLRALRKLRELWEQRNA